MPATPLATILAIITLALVAMGRAADATEALELAKLIWAQRQ